MSEEKSKIIQANLDYFRTGVAPPKYDVTRLPFPEKVTSEAFTALLFDINSVSDLGDKRTAFNSSLNLLEFASSIEVKKNATENTLTANFRPLGSRQGRAFNQEPCPSYFQGKGSSNIMGEKLSESSLSRLEIIMLFV